MSRQGTGDEIERTGEAAFQRLAEHRQTLRQFHTVEAILHLVVVASDVDLAETVLRDPRNLQQHLVQRGILAARHRRQRQRAELMDRGAETRLDRTPRPIEAMRGYGDLLQRRRRALSLAMNREKQQQVEGNAGGKSRHRRPSSVGCSML